MRRQFYKYSNVLLLICLLNLAFLKNYGQSIRSDDTDSESVQIVFRAKRPLSEKALDFLAKIAEPRIVKRNREDSIRSIAQNEYGPFGEVMITRISSANSQQSSDPGSLFLPPGPLFKLNSEQGKSIFTFGMGRISRKHKLKSLFVSYDIKPEYRTQVDRLVSELTKMQEIYMPHVANPQMISPIGFVNSGGGCHSPSPMRPDWFKDALKVDKINLDRIGNTPITVGFFDTGVGAYEFNSKRVPDPRFDYWTNVTESYFDINGTDDDGDFYEDNIYGVDVTVTSRGEANPYNITLNSVDQDDCVRFIDANHGTHVAGILSGQFLPQAFISKLKGQIALLPIKVTDSTGQLEGAAVARAWDFLRFQKTVRRNRPEFPKVVNLSYADSNPYFAHYEIANTLFSETLFVAAAGNKSPSLWNGTQQELDEEHELLPSSLGNKYPNFLSVAALDENGDLADFSFFGVETVDLAAPGEGIFSTYKDDVNIEKPTMMGYATGTSQAAPFVTFTAALIAKMGVTDVSAIRRRIIASTDFRPGLREKVWSSGSLNIAKALAIYNDVVQLNERDGSGHTMIQGLIGRPLNISVLVPTADNELRKLTFPIEQVRKIIFDFEREPTGRKWSAIIVSTEGDKLDSSSRSLRFIKCRIDEDETIGIYRDLGTELDDKESLYAFSEVSEITFADPPKGFPRNRRVDRILQKANAPRDNFDPAILFIKVPFPDVR